MVFIGLIYGFFAGISFCEGLGDLIPGLGGDLGVMSWMGGSLVVLERVFISLGNY